MLNSTFVLRLALACSLAMLSAFGRAQVTVSGSIVSASDGSPLPGATILEKGTRNGTISNANGEFSLSVSSNGAVLVITYTGYVRQEVAVTVGGPMRIVMEEDLSSLSDVVVSTTRVPVRKIEAITAITTLSPRQLEAARPEGVAEAVFGTPGVYSSFAQGRFRGAIFTRGFPDGTGNGLVYTSIMLDGLPALASTSRPPDFAFGMDPNVERIEIVRGNAATLFGRAAAAGVVNIITRTGGTKLSATVRQTFYNDNTPAQRGMDFKTEVNVNGPIGKAKNLRFNIGGFYLRDNGFRDLGAPDKGYQFRANFDYFLPKRLGRIRVYGQLMDITIQNNIDIPFRVSDHLPKPGWKITDSYYHQALDTIFYTVTNKQGQQERRSIRKSHEEGNYARGGNAGVEVNLELGGGWTIVNLFRYQNYDHGTKFNLGVSATYRDVPFGQTRVLVDGDGNDTELMNELRITKAFEGNFMSHRLTLGGFYTDGFYTPTTYTLAGWSNADRNNLTFRRFGPSPTLPAPSTGSQARIDEYDVTVAAVFFGDEIKFGERLKVNAGVRYDQIDMNIKGFYTTNPPTPNVNRDEKHSDWSASIGANYLLSGRSAVYGSVVRAYRMPDYDAYSPARPTSLNTNPRIAKNEIVYNVEAGYRTGIGDLSADIALFHTRINNRLATIYEGAVATVRPLGTNRILGAEIGLTYAPRAVRGLLVQASYTLQKGTFVDFKIPVSLNAARKPNLNVDGPLFGNKVNFEGILNDTVKIYSIDLRGKQLPTVPAHIFNFTANYDHKFLNVNLNGTWNGTIYADATNVFKMEDFILVNAGILFKLPIKGIGSLRAGVLGKNLLNRQEALRALYILDNDSALVLRQRIAAGTVDPNNTFFTGIPAQPRRFLFTIEYRF
ncbi:MAG: TonB-dependent receptor [Saprospiraceae bacterium]|nr:TonB-dependent receptor [Saprospiraceae bacterium]MDW8483263.1 TonB-dependent receptor [Saprospiraceae bacterium]